MYFLTRVPKAPMPSSPAVVLETGDESTMLFGLSPNDLPNIAGVSLLLLVVALFAGYLPARRASGIDAVVALRT
jgi:hypothetical protein